MVAKAAESSKRMNSAMRPVSSSERVTRDFNFPVMWCVLNSVRSGARSL